MLIGRERSEPGRWNRFIACEAIIEHKFVIGQGGGVIVCDRVAWTTSPALARLPRFARNDNGGVARNDDGGVARNG